jgi:hypothetical protein
MAKRKRTPTEAKIHKWIKEGRGQGRGAQYKPWLRIQDVPSKGLSTRVPGWKTSRIHHFLSNLELSYFYHLEWSDVVTDIREQFPLPLEDTVLIAEELGIKHLMISNTQESVVMTTDFLVTVQRGNTEYDVARTCKYAQDLQSENVLKKLEIERVYWKTRNINWGIVTERDMNTVIASNVGWIYEHKIIKDLSADTINRVQSVLTQSITTSSSPLTNLSFQCDDRLGLDPGTSLMIVRHLLASKKWEVDMTHQIQPEERLVIKSIAAVPLLRQAGGAR